jgi:hypothetical protein
MLLMLAKSPLSLLTLRWRDVDIPRRPRDVIPQILHTENLFWN